MAAQVAPELAAPSAIDLTGLGVAGVVVAIVLVVWRLERQERIAAQAALVELTERTITSTAATTEALNRSTDAVKGLTDEVRRMGERRP